MSASARIAMVLCFVFSGAAYAQEADLPALPPFPELPPPLATLSATQAGVLHFATRSPYDLSVLLQGRDAGVATVGMGTLFLPESTSHRAPVAAMVVLHGSGGIKPGREVAVAELLAKHGIAGFVLDYYTPRGVTSETPYMSKVSAATEWDVVADAFAALRLLGAHPAIDAQRIGVMGFSYGGMAARIALDARFAERLAPGAAPFAAHVDYYGPCHFDLGTKRTTGAPLLTLRGADDASNDLVACTRSENALRAQGSAVDAVVFAQAGHAWDVLQPHPRRITPSPYVQGCTLAYDAKGHLSVDGRPLPRAADGASRAARYRVRATSGAHFGDCVKQGYLIGRDDATRARSDRALLAWLADHL